MDVFIYRFYVGSQPKINITDVNLLKQIMVKEFDAFSTRGFPVKHPQWMRLALLCIHITKKSLLTNEYSIIHSFLC